jgi:hypothetical protein
MDWNIRAFILKYKRALVIVLMNYVLLAGIYVYFASSETFIADPWVRGFTPLIPSNDINVEVILILLVYAPISAFIGGLIGGYLVAPIFLFIHKNILGSKFIYGIQDLPQPKTLRKINRGYFPSLLAININSIVLFSAQWILNFILNKEFLELEGGIYTTIYVPAFLVLLMFTVGLGTLVFSPTWFLTDAGIVYSNEDRVAGTDEPVEVRAVGGRFTEFVRGYAGLGVVFSYIQFLSVYISEQAIPPNPLDLVTFLMFFLGLPIFLLIAVIPSLIIFDIMRRHRTCFIRKFAVKLGITKLVKISFKEVNQK